MKSNISTFVIIVIVVLLILLGLFWLMGGGKTLGAVKVDGSRVAANGGKIFTGTTPPGTMYPDANDPAPMVGNTEKNGGLASGGEETANISGGTASASVSGHPTLAAGYIDRDWSRPVREVNVVYTQSGDFDPTGMWDQNTDAVRVVGNASFVFGIYPGRSSVEGLVLEADNIDGHTPEGIGSVTFLHSLHLWPNEEDGWLSEWRVNLPGSGRYCLALCMDTGFGLPIPGETRWLIEVR